jgi:glutamate dehydrogenase (NAD(P)+)
MGGLPTGCTRAHNGSSPRGSFRARGTLVIPDIYANAGVVVVSYFEWLKNLSHVRFGRLGATGDERTIVNAGLEQTMVNAYRAIRERLRRQPALQDLRTAAFATAIDKIARAYGELGIFLEAFAI